MEIRISAQTGVQVVQLEGSLDGNTVNTAQERIMSLLAAGTKMMLDPKACSYISSAGLRLLLMMAKNLMAQKVHLMLNGVCPEIMDIMEMTGFSSFFKTYESVSSAVEALGKAA